MRGNGLDSLEASGSTNGSAGLITAYEIAEQQFIKDGNNRGDPCDGWGSECRADKRE